MYDPAHPFGKKRYDRAIIDPVSCTGCGYCTMFCVMDCILLQPDGFYTVDLDRCIGCRSCKVNCPFEAVIILPPEGGRMTMAKQAHPLGLYLHIPFCRSKCAYCDFYSLPRSESRMDDYTDALCAHLAETAPFAAGHLVDTVYFGGGTPSYLGTKRLVKILKTILKKYKVDKQAEITLEANPDSAGDWKELRTLRRCGFNRLSLGNAVRR